MSFIEIVLVFFLGGVVINIVREFLIPKSLRSYFINRSSLSSYRRTKEILKEMIKEEAKKISEHKKSDMYKYDVGVEKDILKNLKGSLEFLEEQKQIVDKLMVGYDEFPNDLIRIAQYWHDFTTIFLEYVSDWQAAGFLEPDIDYNGDRNIKMDSYKRIFKSRLDGLQIKKEFKI